MEKEGGGEREGTNTKVLLHKNCSSVTESACVQWCRNNFLIGGAQFESAHRVVSNLYNNL